MTEIRKILLVDDEPGVLQALKMLLGLLKVEVDTAGSGRDALTSLDSGVFDLVVSDLRMPGMDGLELLTAIKTRHPGTPFILVSGHADKSDVARAYELGADGFLSKPFTLPQMQALISRL